MPKNKDQVYLSKCVGSLMAYLRLGKVEAAKNWANHLVEYLKKMGLIDSGK